MKIVIADGDKSYELGFTRESIKELEKNGFSVRDAQDEKVSAILLLVEGAFKTYQPDITDEEIWEVWGKLPQKDSLYPAIIELFQEPIKMLDNPDEKKGNASWKVEK